MMNIDKSKGFTLIEMLVAIGVFSLVVIAVSGIMIYSWRATRIISEQLSTQSEGRKVVKDLTNELRSASASSIGSYPIVSATAQSLTFYTNLDSDSLRERVRYFLSGTTLKKGVIKPTGTPFVYNPALESVSDVTHDIGNGTSSIFYYYDQNFTGASGTAMTYPINVTNIRMVELRLKVEENPKVSPAPFYIDTKVEIRNLKSN